MRLDGQRFPSIDALEDLPVLSAGPGEKVTLSFEIRPDAVTVRAYPQASDAEASQAVSQTVPMEDKTALVLPSDCADTIFEVCGQWASGQGSYAFYIVPGPTGIYSKTRPRKKFSSTVGFSIPA